MTCSAIIALLTLATETLKSLALRTDEYTAGQSLSDEVARYANVLNECAKGIGDLTFGLRGPMYRELEDGFTALTAAQNRATRLTAERMDRVRPSGGPQFASHAA